MSNNENKLPKLEPTYKPEIIEPEQPVEEPIVTEDPGIKDVKTNDPIVTTTTVDPTPNPEDIIEEEVEEEEEDEPVGVEPKVIYVERVGCLGRIKRIFRWISYRFWALFWLIIYTLLIIWLCRYCDRPNCDAYCEKLKKTKEELKDLEQRVRERCDTTYVKPH